MVRYLILGLSIFCYPLQGFQNQKPDYYFNPSWSPDGSKILFESHINGQSNIYTISKDGKNLVQITNQGGGQPSWSPDGEMIVYYRKIDDKLQLFTNSSVGGSESRLLRSETQDYGPRWSSKGLIAFMSNITADHFAHTLYTVDSKGNNLKQLTDTTYDCMSPLWSPKGDRIVYIRGAWTSKTYKELSRDEVMRLSKTLEVVIMHSNGSQAHTLATNESDLINPVWSLNGRYIYLKKDIDSATEIYRINTRGKGLKKICTINKSIGSFDISPSGKQLVFEYSENKKNSLYVFDLESKTDQILIGGTP